MPEPERDGLWGWLEAKPERGYALATVFIVFGIVMSLRPWEWDLLTTVILSPLLILGAWMAILLWKINRKLNQ